MKRIEIQIGSEKVIIDPWKDGCGYYIRWDYHRDLSLTNWELRFLTEALERLKILEALQ